MNKNLEMEWSDQNLEYDQKWLGEVFCYSNVVSDKLGYEWQTKVFRKEDYYWDKANWYDRLWKIQVYNTNVESPFYQKTLEQTFDSKEDAQITAEAFLEKVVAGDL